MEFEIERDNLRVIIRNKLKKSCCDAEEIIKLMDELILYGREIANKRYSDALRFDTG